MMGLIGGSHLIQTLLVLQNRNRKKLVAAAAI
jgi:hypothetical protein